jgi:hypothetical protein
LQLLLQSTAVHVAFLCAKQSPPVLWLSVISCKQLKTMVLPPWLQNWFRHVEKYHEISLSIPLFIRQICRS